MEAFAERIRGDVDVTLLGLRVWGLAPGDGYDMGVEVAWDPAEAKWRSAIGSLRAAAGPEQAETFREMLMAPGEPAPPSPRPVAWDFRDDVLGTMLSGHTGFESSDLARIGVPVLLVRGGRSAVRFSPGGGWARYARTSGNPCSRRSTTSLRRFARIRRGSRTSCAASGSRRERVSPLCTKSSPPRNDSITGCRYRGSCHGIRELGGVLVPFWLVVGTGR